MKNGLRTNYWTCHNYYYHRPYGFSWNSSTSSRLLSDEWLV